MKNILVIILFSPIFLYSQIKYEHQTYHIDFDGGGKPYNNYWSATGFTPSTLMFRKDMQLTFDYIRAIPNEGITYIRPHWMLNLVGSRNITSNYPEYNYEMLYKALDELISRDFIPIFEIMGFPNLSWEIQFDPYNLERREERKTDNRWVPDFNNRADYLKWHAFIKDMIKNLELRYGVEEISKWYFECTNEPNHPSYWTQGIPALLNYWDATAEAIKSINPRYRFGGPGVAGGNPEVLEVILAHCEKGINAITERQGSVLDFISVHRKATPFEMVRQEMEDIEYIRKDHPGLSNIPFWNDESDPTSGWDRHYWWRAGPWYAAFLIQSIDAHNRILIDSMKVNYGVLLNDNGFLGNWYQRTLLARHSNPKNEAHFWLFKKPVMNAMTMLALSEGKRYTVTNQSSSRKRVSIIPSKNKHNEIIILLANKPDFGSVNYNREPNDDIPLFQRELYDSQGAYVELLLENIGIESPVITQLVMDPLHGNTHGLWKDINKPDLISKEEYFSIAAHMEPVLLMHSHVLEKGKLLVHLPPASVRMIIITDNKNENVSDQPKIITINKYVGQNNELKNFILWQQSPGGIFFYNIYASYDDNEYIKINPTPLLENGFLDVLPDNIKKAEYYIEAIKI